MIVIKLIKWLRFKNRGRLWLPNFWQYRDIILNALFGKGLFKGHSLLLSTNWFRLLFSPRYAAGYIEYLQWRMETFYLILPCRFCHLSLMEKLQDDFRPQMEFDRS